MRDLVKTTAAIGVTEVLLMGVSLIRNKFLAVTIGPQGFGVFGLLNSFFLMISAFAGTWVVVGTTKYIAEYQGRGDKRGAERVFSASVGVTCGLSVIIAFIIVLQKDWVLAWFFDENVKEEYFLIFIVAFLAMNIRPLLLGILQGMRRIREVVLGRLGIAGVDLLLVITLVLSCGLTGYFLSILIGSFFAVFVFVYAIVNKDGLKLRKLSIKDEIIKKLFIFGFFSIFLSIINSGSQYLQRIIVLNYFDLAAVGLFHAGVALKGYVGVINRGASFYYLPQMSVEMGNEARKRDINDFMRLILILSILPCLVAILFGKSIILLLYSEAFVPLVPVFVWFVFAEFFTNVGTALTIPLVGTARLKMHSISSIVVHSLWVIVPLVFVKKYGLSAFGFGFLVGSLVGPLMNGYYLWRCMNFKFSYAVVKLLFVGTSALVGALLLKFCPFLYKLLWVFLSLLLVCLQVKRDEWNHAYVYITTHLPGRNQI